MSFFFSTFYRPTFFLRCPHSRIHDSRIHAFFNIFYITFTLPFICRKAHEKRRSTSQDIKCIGKADPWTVSPPKDNIWNVISHLYKFLTVKSRYNNFRHHRQTEKRKKLNPCHLFHHFSPFSYSFFMKFCIEVVITP